MMPEPTRTQSPRPAGRQVIQRQRPRRAVLVLTALILGLAGAALPARAADASAGDTPARPVMRLGLMIGIDEYADPSVPDLDGCVNDVTAMRELFARRFGFTDSNLLVNEQATRANIAKAMRDLIAKARGFADEGYDVRVLIYYAGHGSQVADRSGDEADQRDETWVAHDSTMTRGQRDVLDDELDAVIRTLVANGAEVIQLSDSCHSGTVHRGRATVKSRSLERFRGKSRGGDAAEAPSGPDDALFDDIVAGADAAADDRPEGSAGHVVYAASHDTERAWEHVDQEGRSHGRFSYVLLDVLSQVGPSETYESIHRRIVERFAALWPDRLQAPQFAGSHDRANRRFLGAGFAPPHARIVPRSMQQGRLKITAGNLDGVATGARVSFFASLADLEDNAEPIAVGHVTRVEALESEIELQTRQDVRESAVARIDRVRFDDFAVYLAPKTPDATRRAVTALADQGRLKVVDEPSAAQVAVYHDADAGLFRLYWPTALPTGDPAERPEPIRSVSTRGQHLEENLLYLAQVHRLMTLSRPGQRLPVEVTPLSGGQADKSRGVPALTDGQEFTIDVTNNGHKPMYYYVFYFDQQANDGNGQLLLLYPGPGEEPRATAPGKTLRIGRHNAFVAHATDRPSRTRAKVLAVDRPMSFAHLLQPPSPGKPAASRGDDADGFLGRVLNEPAPANSRTMSRNPPRQAWAVGDVIFDAVPARP